MTNPHAERLYEEGEIDRAESRLKKAASEALRGLIGDEVVKVCQAFDGNFFVKFKSGKTLVVGRDVPGHFWPKVL